MAEAPAVHRVLIVDDEPTILQSCGRMLEHSGYRVELLASADAALERCRRQSYDLVLLDLLLPGRSGIALLEAFQELAPATRIVVMTGFGTPATAADAYRRGAHGFLPKPFLPSELRSSIAQAMIPVAMAAPCGG